MDGVSVFVERVRGGVRRRFCVDRRALAVFRVTLGVVVLADLSMRARDLRVFYTDDGVLPRETLAELFPGIARFSLHSLSGALWAQVVLFGVSALFAVALLVGYRSRTSAFVSLVLLVSLYARNPFVLNGGDTMLLVALLLGSTLPIGARWSVDALGRDDAPSETVFSVAGAVLLVFLVVIYASNAVLRYRGELWMSGDAVRSVFGLESVTVLLGPYLAEMPALLVVINWMWVAMLTVSVLLLLLTGWLRAFLTGAFVVAHLGMALTLRLGVFPFVVIALLLLFLPPVFWDRFETHVPSGFGSRGPDAFAVSRARLTPESARRALRRGASATAVVILVTVLFWQGAALGYVEAPGDSVGAHPENYAWKMYSPTPPQTDGWYVVPVELRSGETIDGIHRTSVEWDAPLDLADAYPTILWYRYLSEMRYSSETQKRAFAEYVCDSVSEEEGEVLSVGVYYVEREVVLDGTGDEDRVELLKHDCS
ncbi:MAG: HTTM domain-containing protein [Halobacteriales archaeon]|nr:HTTM domain-containing protein [Halobacteriales archaeon]